MTYLLYISGAVFAFCGVYLLLCTFWKDRLTIRERLERLQGGKAKKAAKKNADGKKKFAFIRVSEALKSNIDLAGIKMGPEEFVMVWIVVAFLPALILLVVLVNPLAAVFTVCIAAFAPIIFLRAKISKQRSLFERQLGDALLVISNALRAGFSFPQALASAANNLSEPISKEFTSISRELQLGVDIEEAMMKVVKRMDSSDLRLVATAVVIQKQAGGNLSEILDTVSKTVRDRLAIKRSVQTLTAQGRISGKVIGVMPLVLLVAISVMNPTYAMPLFTTTLGRIMLIFGAVMEAAGFFVINKIVDIKF